MSKKIISILLAVVMLLSTPLVISGSGISRGDVVLLTYGEITYRYKQTATGFIMEGISSDGTIVERSVFHNGIVTQEMAGGKNDSLAYVVSDAISITDNFSKSGMASTDIISPVQSRAGNAWYDPPLMSNAGLARSSIFPGYFYLGTTNPDDIFGVSVSVHRNLSYFGEFDAYRFTVSPGTTITTLASIFIAFFTPATLLQSVAIALATMFIGAGIDTIATGTLQYEQYHYTYKFNCNNETTYTQKCCECREFWCIYNAQGYFLGYEDKDVGAKNHFAFELPVKCDAVITDYINGVQQTIVCDEAA